MINEKHELPAFGKKLTRKFKTINTFMSNRLADFSHRRGAGHVNSPYKTTRTCVTYANGEQGGRVKNNHICRVGAPRGATAT